MQAIPIASASTDVAAYSGRCQLWGLAVTENAGSPAASSIDFSFGTATGGPIFLSLNLGADESIVIFFPEPLACEGGVFIDRTGTIKGTLFLR